jgi:hypothetical protein
MRISKCVFLLVIVIAALLLTSCDNTPLSMDQRESTECIQMVQKILADNEFILEDYAVLDDRLGWLFMLQYRNGQSSYYEKKGNTIKYYKDGRAYIVENEEQRDDNGFVFSTYTDQIDNLYDKIRSTLIHGATSEFTVYNWPKVSDPHPARVYITCNLEKEVMDILNLGSEYNEFELGIDINREKKVIKTFEIVAQSGDSSSKLYIHFGNLDENLVMPYPE